MADGTGRYRPSERNKGNYFSSTFQGELSLLCHAIRGNVADSAVVSDHRKGRCRISANAFHEEYAQLSSSSFVHERRAQLPLILCLLRHPLSLLPLCRICRSLFILLSIQFSQTRCSTPRNVSSRFATMRITNNRMKLTDSTQFRPRYFHRLSALAQHEAVQRFLGRTSLRYRLVLHECMSCRFARRNREKFERGESRVSAIATRSA